MKQATALFIALIVIIALFGGVYVAMSEDEPEDKKVVVEPWSPFNFNRTIPKTTYYHFDGGIDATEEWWNMSADLNGTNAPYWANGTYYSIGVDTFEPTIGVTSKGTLFMTSHNGLGEGTHIIRSKDQGQTWEDVTPNPNVVRNSNDPYLYVDPWTDRVVKFDMHALTGMTFEYSDDEGDSWELLGMRPVTGPMPQDHQTIASTPYQGGLSSYPTTYVYSINTGLQGGYVGGSYGATSWDGGNSWDLDKPHYDTTKGAASGLSGHLVGSEDGAIYRGQPASAGPAAYRSLDGGLTWTEHVISSTTGSQTHEVAIYTDEASNVHAFWIGDDSQPYYSNSQDQGNTWRPQMMVAPPGVNGTGFPTIAAGAEGRAAFSYIGLNPQGTGWSGYLGVITDAFVENPLITTVEVNDPNDVLDTTDDCGYRRCGGFGDFIDICIDPDGRPWAALAHNQHNDMGIVGTYMYGPSLRGEIDSLPPLPVGGPSTI